MLRADKTNFTYRKTCTYATKVTVNLARILSHSDITCTYTALLHSVKGNLYTALLLLWERTLNIWRTSWFFTYKPFCSGHVGVIPCCIVKQWRQCHKCPLCTKCQKSHFALTAFQIADWVFLIQFHKQPLQKPISAGFWSTYRTLTQKYKKHSWSPTKILTWEHQGHWLAALEPFRWEREVLSAKVCISSLSILHRHLEASLYTTCNNSLSVPVPSFPEASVNYKCYTQLQCIYKAMPSPQSMNATTSCQFNE